MLNKCKRKGPNAYKGNILCGGIITGYLMTLYHLRLLFTIEWSTRLTLFAELEWIREEAI